ncbi:hypothetical protein MKK69_24895 [Methylobacterium sp. J-026]|uniref:hypothetical protein n=1 Tax=Methylobacterium sp. J-026 TaxID=2836624 RepID=UPI001FB94824|nr:hypothetical protein [Methylobacterium sp. J-026]MCJ2137242.1 hypothetical protein [Methylobacterium sp. J-026]
MITSGAGLVGQNRIPYVQAGGFTAIAMVDKTTANAAILKDSHTDIDAFVADIAVGAGRQDRLAGVGALVRAQPLCERGFTAPLPIAQGSNAGLPIADIHFACLEDRRISPSGRRANAMGAGISA